MYGTHGTTLDIASPLPTLLCTQPCWHPQMSRRCSAVCRAAARRAGVTARNVGRGSLLHVVINVFSATDCRKRKTMRVRFADQLPATRRYRRNGGTKQRRSQRGSEYIHSCNQDRPGHYCPIPGQSDAGSKCSLALCGNYEMTAWPSQAAVPTNCSASPAPLGTTLRRLR